MKKSVKLLSEAMGNMFEPGVGVEIVRGPRGGILYGQQGSILMSSTSIRRLISDGYINDDGSLTELARHTVIEAVIA